MVENTNHSELYYIYAAAGFCLLPDVDVVFSLGLFSAGCKGGEATTIVGIGFVRAIVFMICPVLR